MRTVGDQVSDLHQQATELRNVAKQLHVFVAGHTAASVAKEVAERAEQLLAEVVRLVPPKRKPGPISYRSELD